MKLSDWLRRHPLWLLVTLAFIVRLLPATVRFVIGSDEGLFLTLAQNLAAGRGYTGDGLVTQIDFPPGYPLFAAAIYWLGGGLELPSKLNLLLFGSLLPLPVYWLAGQLTDKQTAFRAGLFTALLPALVLGQANFEAAAEQAYPVLLYTGWASLGWGLSQRRLLAFGLAGLAIGAAHLVRWEGVILGLLGAGVIVLALRRAMLRPVLFFLAGLALFAAPYGLYLYQHTGSFVSPKATITRLHGAALAANAGDPYAFEKSYGFYDDYLAAPRTPPGIPRESLPAFLGHYLGNVLFELRLWFTSLSLLTVVWIVPALLGLWAMERRRTLFLGLLFVPLAMIPASVVDPRYFLPVLPAAMIFAAYGWTWLEKRLPAFRRADLWSMETAGTLGVSTKHENVIASEAKQSPHGNWRLLRSLGSLAVTCQAIFRGVFTSVRHATDNENVIASGAKQSPRWRGRLLRSLGSLAVTCQAIFAGSLREPVRLSLTRVLLIATLSLFTLADLAGPFLYPRPTAYRTAGLALRGELPSDAHILARKRQVPFYAGGVWEWLPFAELPEVLAYASSQNADYLVLDEFTTPSLRPQLVYLLDPAKAPAMLTPVYVDKTGQVVVYRINH